MTRFITLLISIVISTNSLSAQVIPEHDLSAHFKKFGVDGCFVLFDEAEHKYLLYNSVTCDSGYIPASTFKIPHALIALETGLVEDTSRIIPWNGQPGPVKAWNKDQTLKTAIKYSCVWVFTGFAEKLGIQEYYKYVNDFDYGNRDLRGPTNRFWLAGSFRISARQQVEFLRRFFHYQLPVSERSVNMIKDCIVLEKNKEYILSGKTGGGVVSDTDYVMWLVGYLEREGRVYYFAMNFRSGDFEKTAGARYEITKSILAELGLL